MTYPLIAAMFEAPLIGVLRRWPNTAHALTMESVVDGWTRQTFEAACGRTGLRMWAMKRGDDLAGSPWPPRIKGMPDGLDRCRDCWVATGKKAPRTEWVSR